MEKEEREIGEREEGDERVGEGVEEKKELRRVREKSMEIEWSRSRIINAKS